MHFYENKSAQNWLTANFVPASRCLPETTAHCPMKSLLTSLVILSSMTAWQELRAHEVENKEMQRDFLRVPVSCANLLKRAEKP